MLFVQKKERFFWTWGICLILSRVSAPIIHCKYSPHLKHFSWRRAGGRCCKHFTLTSSAVMPLCQEHAYACDLFYCVVCFLCSQPVSVSVKLACPKEKIQDRRVHPVSCVSTHQEPVARHQYTHYWSELVNCHASIEIANRIWAAAIIECTG